MSITPSRHSGNLTRYSPGCLLRGAIATFATEGTGFSEAFPGLQPHLLTLTSNFNVPIYREILLLMGICSVSKQSCSNILRRGAGQAITIVVGGAAESLAARPGTADLTLRRRCVLDLIYCVHRFSLLYICLFQAWIHQDCHSAWVCRCSWRYGCMNRSSDSGLQSRSCSSLFIWRKRCKPSILSLYPY